MAAPANIPISVKIPRDEKRLSSWMPPNTDKKRMTAN
jgi:hypothetical protein